MSSADLSFTILVSRSCLGRETLANVEPFAGELHGFGFLQSGHHGAHVDHADLRIVLGLGQIAGGPAEQGRGAGAARDLVFAAFDAFEDFERAVRD